MKRLFGKIFNWALFIVASLVVLIAVLLSLARLFVPHLTQYKPRIEQWVSQTIQRPVHIGQMQAAWSGFEPQFQFSNVEILNPAGTRALVRVKQLGVGINLFKSLIRWRLQPGLLVVSGMRLSIRQDANGKITVNGLSTESNPNQPTNFQDAFNWLLSQGKIYLQDVNVTWYGKNGLVLPLKNIEFELTNELLSHQFLGAAELKAATPTRFHFVLNVNGDALNSKAFKAELYLRIPKFVIPAWFQEHPIAGMQISSGRDNLKLWVYWSQQQLQTIQAVIGAIQVSLKASALKHPLVIPQLAANILWQRQSDGGWALAGNNVNFQFNQDNWSNLEFSYRSLPTQIPKLPTQILQMNLLNLQNLKNLLLATNLLSATQTRMVNQLNPSGELSDLTITHSGAGKQLSQFSLTTVFNHLSWQHWQKIPGVSNLTGVIQWMPTYGALALASNSTQLDFGHLFRAPLPLDTLHADAVWNRTSHGWQIHATHIGAQNSLISLQGNLRLLLPADHRSPIMDLLAGFNLINPPQALQYMPIGIMSPPLSDRCSEQLLQAKVVRVV